MPVIYFTNVGASPAGILQSVGWSYYLVNMPMTPWAMILASPFAYLQPAIAKCILPLGSLHARPHHLACPLLPSNLVLHHHSFRRWLEETTCIISLPSDRIYIILPKQTLVEVILSFKRSPQVLFSPPVSSICATASLQLHVSLQIEHYMCVFE